VAMQLHFGETFIKLGGAMRLGVGDHVRASVATMRIGRNGSEVRTS
jgi:hypothetical protein